MAGAAWGKLDSDFNAFVAGGWVRRNADWPGATMATGGGALFFVASAGRSSQRVRAKSHEPELRPTMSTPPSLPPPTGNVMQVLREREMLADCSNEEFEKHALENATTVYAGFDPTANSLHIGNLVVVMGLKRFQMAGHRPIAVVGGGTGLIGDPSGKREDRKMMTREMVRDNVRAMRLQLERFLDFSGPTAAIMEDNADWLVPISFIDFLRDTGRHFRLGDMLGKDSVRSRLESEAGLSFTEFCYMLLQAHDFRHLFEQHRCTVQCGGSDQWGNITAGIELIRRTIGAQAYGVTFPLLTTASGQKFGKSEAGAVYLDPARTSPYEFFQYWIRTDDRDAERFLKIFTLLSLEEIAGVMAQHRSAPEKRLAQRRLAMEVTTTVHGADEARKASEASAALFAEKLSDLSDEKLRELFPQVPSVAMSRADLERGIPVAELLVKANLAASKGEARRLIDGGGAYLNNVKIESPAMVVTREHLASESSMVLRAGKKSYAIARFE